MFAGENIRISVYIYISLFKSKFVSLTQVERTQPLHAKNDDIHNSVMFRFATMSGHESNK